MRSAQHPSIAARLLWPTLATAIALAILIALGVWQLERRDWKAGLKAQIAERTRLAPVPLADALARTRRDGDLEYTRVRATGRFLADKALFYYAPEPGEPGWQLFMPLVTGPGRVVIVNRGFVPAAWKPNDTQARASGAPQGLPAAATPAGDVEIVGLLRGSEERGFFTPDNDVARNTWYWRDLDGMAAAMFPRERRGLAPYFLDAEAGAAGAPRYPRGGATRLVLPDRHFEYALTWFGFALSLLGVYALFAYRRIRGGNDRSATSRTDAPRA